MAHCHISIARFESIMCSCMTTAPMGSFCSIVLSIHATRVAFMDLKLDRFIDSDGSLFFFGERVGEISILKAISAKNGKTKKNFHANLSRREEEKKFFALLVCALKPSSFVVRNKLWNIDLHELQVATLFRWKEKNRRSPKKSENRNDTEMQSLYLLLRLHTRLSSST